MRLRFAGSTIPEEKWGLHVVYQNIGCEYSLNSAIVAGELPLLPLFPPPPVKTLLANKSLIYTSLCVVGV